MVTAACSPEVGLVLSGGGARGAYEAGALSVLLPHLESRGERPGIVLGTSIGALNACHIAASADLPAKESSDGLLERWRTVQFSDIIGPLISPRQLGRLVGYLGGVAGLPSRSPALLDTTPLPGMLDRLIDFEKLYGNVDDNLVSLAVVATSYAKGDSVVFHDGPLRTSVPDDARRAIRYFPTRVERSHVQASASIPVAFSATKVKTPAGAAGWYGDGGTRLNTPLKPALKLGAKRVIVIGLNSSVPPRRPERGRPDVFDGAAQFVQALLADPISDDVATLSERNLEGRGESVPYIFIAPRDRLAVGKLATKVFRERLSGLGAFLRARDLVALGRIIGAGEDAARGELFSFLFFATEFHDALIELGRRDAARWLREMPKGDPWRVGDPPPTPARGENGRARVSAATGDAPRARAPGSASRRRPD